MESQQEESPVLKCDSEAIQQADESKMNSNSAPQLQVPQPQSRLSSLEFENQMLKNEISSQKEELDQVSPRLTILETGKYD